MDDHSSRTGDRWLSAAEGFRLDLVIKLVTLAALLVFVQELFRRGGRWLGWGAFFVLPLVLTPYWVWSGRAGVYTGLGLFPWVKLYSVQIVACWLTAVRFTRLGHKRWALGLVFLMLPVNILEAVARDAFGGHLAHYLVGLSGILLIICVPHPMRAIHVDTTGDFRDLQYLGLTRTWIVAYTLWNWAFVYLNFPSIAGHQLAVLAAAFLVGMAEPSRWFQARTYTLAADLMVLPTAPGVMIPYLDTAHWAVAPWDDVAAGACLVIGVVYAVGLVVRRGIRSIGVVAAEPDAAPAPSNSNQPSPRGRL